MNLNLKRFTAGTIVTILCMGFVLGMAVGKTVLAGFAGFGWSLVSMTVGMVLGQIHVLIDYRKKQDEVQQELENQQTLIKLEREDLRRRRESLGRDSMGLVRAVTDRVVNRILSKYVSNLGEDARRNRVFKGVSEIIVEELGRESVGFSVEET